MGRGWENNGKNGANTSRPSRILLATARKNSAETMLASMPKNSLKSGIYYFPCRFFFRHVFFSWSIIFFSTRFFFFLAIYFDLPWKPFPQSIYTRPAGGPSTVLLRYKPCQILAQSSVPFRGCLSPRNPPRSFPIIAHPPISCGGCVSPMNPSRLPPGSPRRASASRPFSTTCDR